MKGFTLNKYKILGVFMIILIWTFFYTMLGNSVILPSPLETTIAFKEIVLSPSFLITIVNTLYRILISFMIGLVLAFILGIIAGLNKSFYDLLSPAISLLQILPTMAIVILALIWLTNERAPILIATIIVFPILYEAIIKGIRDIDPKLLSMTDVYGVATKDIIKYIYIPSIFNNIIAIFPSTIGLSLKIVIGGEVLGQPSNAIGTSIQTEKMYLNTSGVLGWIIVLVILSLLIDITTRSFIYLIKRIRKVFKDGQISY